MPQQTSLTLCNPKPALAARPGSHPDKAFTVPCKYWRNGSCFRGKACLYIHSQANKPENFRIPSSNQIQRLWAAPTQRFGRDQSQLKPSVPSSQSLEGCGSGRFPNHGSRRPSSPSSSSSAAAAAAVTTENQGHADRGASVPREINRTMSQHPSFQKEKKQSWKDIPKSSPLPSYAAAAALRRRQAQEEEMQKYTGDPPPEMELIQLRMVLPRGIDVTRSLGIIRKAKRVWITRPTNDIVDIHAESIKALREALADINWATHYVSEALRTSVPKVLAQAPIQASDQARISLLALRPQVRDPANSSPSLTAAASYTAASLASEFVAGTDAVLGSTKELDMRISFGHLRLSQKQFGQNRSMGYKDLGRLLRICSQRGAAVPDFETRFTEPFRAEMLLRYMLYNDNDACGFPELARDACSLNFEADGLVLSADVVGPATSQPQLAGVRVIETEPGCRLGVIMATPDMKHDWSLEVRTSDHKGIPDDLEKMVMKLKLQPVRREQAHEALRQPSVLPFNLGDFGRKVTETRLRTSATVPWKSTSYLVEIGVTTAWKGVDMRSKSRMYWDVQFYGSHWESTMNRAKPGGQRKDWGEGFREVWPGEAESLTERFGEFVKELLDFQVMLETSH